MYEIGLKYFYTSVYICNYVDLCVNKNKINKKSIKWKLKEITKILLKNRHSRLAIYGFS